MNNRTSLFVLICTILAACTTGCLAGPAVDEFDKALYTPRVIPNEFFATTTHVNYEVSLGLLKDLNIRTVRVDFSHVALEPARGKYSFGDKNWVIASADRGVKSNLDQLVVVTRSAKWIRTPAGLFPNDESVKDFENFMFAIASKYKGKIKYWEAMNEPNMSVWGKRYIIFLKAFYKGVKRADPNNVVVLAGLAGHEPRQLETLYRLGGKDYFDVLNSHSYTRPAMPEQGGYVNKIKELWKVMRANGDDKPIFVTEMGWNGVEASTLAYMRSKYPHHRNYSCSEEDQARGLARLYLISSTVPSIKRVYFFHLLQEAQFGQEYAMADYYMGLVTSWPAGSVKGKFAAWRPKVAYFSVKTVVNQLSGAKLVGRIPMGERIWALAYTRKGRAMIALWSLDDGVTLKLKDASAIKGITSMLGTPILLKGNTLNLSGRPIYLDADAKKLDALKAQIAAATISGDTRYRLSLNLSPEKTRPGAAVLNVSVENVSNRPQAAPSIAVSVEKPWRLANMPRPSRRTIQPGEKRHISVMARGPVTKGGEVVLNASAAIADGGMPMHVRRSSRYMIAPRRPANFKADGDLSEWKKFTPVLMGQDSEQRHIIGWRGIADCSVRWYIASDTKGMYFAAAIKDDVHHQPSTADRAIHIWQSDSIQIGLDTAGDAKPCSNVPQYDGVNDVEFGLASGAGGAGEKAIAFAWEDPRKGQRGWKLKQFAVVRDEASKTTFYEAMIPWSKLPIKHAPTGKWMGVNIVVNDNDGKGRRGWLEWASGISLGKDPSLFPKVRF